MATNIQVSYTVKREHKNVHQRIVSIGGIADGTQWKVSEQEAIAAIRSGAYRFFVATEGRELEVVVASHRGRSYLRTTGDDHACNHLLSLPEHPESVVFMPSRFDWPAETASDARHTVSTMPAIPLVFTNRPRVPRGHRRRPD